jgi:hypothetical protein
MRPSLKVCLCFVLTFGLAGAVNAQSFDLSWDVPADLLVPPDSPVSIEASGVMTPGGLDAGADGAQGWSLSVSSTGWQVTGITTDGTVAADVSMDGLRNTGFEVSELTSAARAGSDCEGSDGAVSAVVLSFVMNITLPTDAASHIVTCTLEGTSLPAGECTDCSVAFVDGCQGAGQPVDNRVTHQGNTIVPGLGSATTTICSEVPPCNEADGIYVNLSGSASQEESDRPGGDPADKVNIEAEAPFGTVGSADVYAAISSINTGTGVQGWSLSVGVSGGNLTGVTTDGTVAADVSMGGKRNTGFEVTELVDPALNDQGQGAVGAVVLSFVMNITLAPTGSATVMCLTVESDGPVEGDQSCEISWIDGLQGSGQPVNNVATIAGSTVRFCGCQTACVNFVPITEIDFLRCDPNDDGKNDLADGIWIVNELFRGGPESTCQDAADCNDDNNVDVSDATYRIAYGFQGGPPPPPPFPDCGQDDDNDVDPGPGCATYSSCP